MTRKIKQEFIGRIFFFFFNSSINCYFKSFVNYSVHFPPYNESTAETVNAKALKYHQFAKRGQTTKKCDCLENLWHLLITKERNAFCLFQESTTRYVHHWKLEITYSLWSSQSLGEGDWDKKLCLAWPFGVRLQSLLFSFFSSFFSRETAAALSKVTCSTITLVWSRSLAVWLGSELAVAQALQR